MESPEVVRLQEFQDFYKKARQTFGGGISTADLWFVFKHKPNIKISRVGGHDDSRGELEGDKSQKGGGQSSDSHAINQGKGWTNWIDPVLEDLGGTGPKVQGEFKVLKGLCKTYGWQLDNTIGVKPSGGKEDGKPDKSKRNEELGEKKQFEKDGEKVIAELYSAAYEEWVKTKCHGEKPQQKDAENFKKDFNKKFDDDLSLNITADEDEDIEELREEKLEQLKKKKSAMVNWGKQQSGPVVEAEPTAHANFDDAFSAWVEASGAKSNAASKKTFIEDVWGKLAPNIRDNKKTVKVVVAQYDKNGNKKGGKK